MSATWYLNLLPMSLPGLCFHITGTGELSPTLNNPFPPWSALTMVSLRSNDLSLLPRVRMLSLRTPKPLSPFLSWMLNRDLMTAFTSLTSQPCSDRQSRGHDMEAPGTSATPPWDCSLCLYPWKTVAPRIAFLPSGLGCHEGESAPSHDNIYSASLGGRCFVHRRDGFATQRSLFCPC